jgi:pimeloyl-ACP methyl ester carboxylesterase
MKVSLVALAALILAGRSDAETRFAQNNLEGSARAQSASPFAPYETPQQRVSVGAGRSINVVCMGEGSPTVILSAGADGWSIDWIRVQYAIARNTKVCAWDRAGHGFSSGSAEPQDIVHTEADMERAMAEVGLTGPLVMVAHSLGAFETLVFADRHPDRVAGMVLVDPSTPDQERRLAQAAPTLKAFSDKSNKPFFDGIRHCIAVLKSSAPDPSPDCAKIASRYPEPLRANLLAASHDPAYWEAFLSIFQSLRASSNQAINAKRDYGAMPLIVLHAGRLPLPNAPEEVQREAPAFGAVSLAGQEALAGLSTRGTLVSVDSAHYIAGQKPDAVIGAVGTVIDDVRASRVEPRR